MKTVDKYKKEILDMFFVSVEQDIKNWHGFSNTWSKSRDFDGGNYFKINFDESKLTLITDKTYVEICKYKKNIFNDFFTKIKIRKYARKINKHLINAESDKIDSKQIESLKFALTKIQNVYVKEVRKQKLDKIS